MTGGGKMSYAAMANKSKDDTKDSVKDAGNKAKDSVKDAGNKAQDSVKDAGNKAQNTVSCLISL